MSPPVQLKIFGGMMLVTKRTYLLLSLAGFVTLLVVWGALTFVFGPSTWVGKSVTDLMPWFYDALPWLCVAGIVLETIEMIVVLRRFRQREEFLRRERAAGEFEGDDPVSPTL